MEEKYGTDSMAETAENVAEAYHIDRHCQDQFAFARSRKQPPPRKRSLRRRNRSGGRSGTKRIRKVVAEDEHIRPDTTLEKLAKLPAPFRENGTVTAGNASGINDGACALFVASETAAAKFGLTPIARVVATATAGVEPRVMGIGPIPAGENCSLA